MQALRSLVMSWMKNRVAGLAAEVSYFGIFSIFPGLLILAGALASLEELLGQDLATRSEEKVVGLLQGVLTDRANPLIDSVRALFHSSGSGLLTAGALVAVWSLSSGFATLVNALDLIGGAQQQRSWLKVRLLALGLGLASVLLFCVLLLLTLIGPLFGLGQAAASALGLGEQTLNWWEWLSEPIALLLLIAWTTTIYRVAPAERLPWLRHLPGAVAAAVGWLIASAGLSLYLRHGAQGSPALNAIGGGLILMLWLYVLALLVLGGAELNALLARRRVGG